jgi:glutamyl-tRNA synthetase
MIKGRITVANSELDDLVIMRTDGIPTYNFGVVIDDWDMGITHVIRGDDHVNNTPRQINILKALGATVPQYAHLSMILGDDGQKLSKRRNSVAVTDYDDNGYLPEGLLNYLALLGWSMGDDIEFFSKQEMADAFALDRVSPNPARFDLKKCTAINADWIRKLSASELIDRVIPFLQAAELVAVPPTPEQIRLLEQSVPLIQERMDTLTQAVENLAFLFVPEERFALDPTDAAAMLGPDAQPTLEAAITALESLEPWGTEAIEGALRTALIDGLGLKPKVAFGPVRVAITGRRISPPLFESLEILGRPVALARLRAARS